MSAVETKKVQTGNYQTFIHEGGDTSSETIIFLHGSGPGVSAKSNWQHILTTF